MSSKRPANESPSSSGGAPPKKKLYGVMESIKLGPITSLEELDKKVLQFQNKKLAERLEQRRMMEDELRKRIEQLEHRQATDDAVLMIINRYWNQLDEDIRVLLQRFDAEAADENEKTENEATTSFLAQLSSWDQQEMEAQQNQRVEFSKRAIGKLLLAYDRLLLRHEKMVESIKVKGADDEDKSSDAGSESKDEKEDKPKSEDGEKEGETQKPKEDVPSLEEVVKKEIVDTVAENKRLHNLVTQLHERHHVNTLKSTEMEEKFTRAETEIAELKNKIDDLEYEFENSQNKVFKLEKRCIELVQQKQMQNDTATVVPSGETPTVSKSQVSDSWLRENLTELEEVRELAANRLQELEELQSKHQDTVRTLEQVRMDLKTLPEAVIVETTEYKCLQSQFSVLYNECMQIKTLLEENRQLLQASKNTHLRQIEQMESDELACQKNLRAEVINLEDTLAQCRKEYEMLRIEFEQTLAANEQTGPINREMRNLITSLQNHNHQLKVEISRFKKKIKDISNELSKLKSEGKEAVESQSEEVKPVVEVKEAESPVEVIPDEPIIIKDDEKEEPEVDKGKPESEVIKDLRAQLKKANDSQKELKLLLDMYKSAPKEQKDKVKLMCEEKKAKQEIDELKGHIRRMQEAQKKERRKLADDDAIKKIRKLEEQLAELQKQLAAQKQEEEALLNEMEVTGQAFEDMQEQNVRLIQQLREKDDANFKLMSERIKSNQIQKLLKEEKDILEEQVTTVHSQVEAQNVVVRKLEEKERVLQNNLHTVEKELSLRQQAMEMHKRKAIESAQTAADLKLHLDKYTSQLREAQTALCEKVATLERELYKSKRVNEELASLRKKLERHKKIEMAETADEVLMEEIREYKEQLTCPSCKVKRKDAVLTKCFHVFCLECLKTRYETRQRKCPKCNAAFGANDFHRIYIG